MAQKESPLTRYLPFLIMFIALSVRLLPGARTIDDSYITYRYARNILAGDGFVYNPGERVLGTTTPLYTLILTVLGAITGGVKAPFPILALIFNALIGATTTLLLWKIGKRMGSTFTAASTALLWAIAPFSVTFAIGGLETSLYVFLLTATVAFYLSDRFTLTALFATFSFLTRPDALILLGPVAVDRLYQASKRQPEDKRKKISFAELAAALIPAIIWFGFATFYFGSPIPHSVLAKSLAYRIPNTAALVRMLQHYATPFLGQKTFGIPWIGVGLILYPFLTLIGIRSAIKKELHIWPWAFYPWLYFATFTIANPFIFLWYMTPPLPAYFFFIFLGLEQVGSKLLHRIKGKQKNAFCKSHFRRGLPILGILFPLLLTLQGWTLQPDHGLNRPAPDMAWIKIELLYQEAAKQLNEHLESHPPPSTPVLAAGDVGVLGYFTETHILDTVGLNSPETLDYYPLDESCYAINYAIPPELIQDQQPDYLVILEVYGRKGLLIDTPFKDTYRLLSKLPTDIYGSEGMLIFESTMP